MRTNIIKATRLFDTPEPAPRRDGPKGDKCKLRPPEPLYTAGNELDWTWYAREVAQVIEAYNTGASGVEIAAQLKRREIEIFVLLDDLLRYKRIRKRKGGWWG